MLDIVRYQMNCFILSTFLYHVTVIPDFQTSLFFTSSASYCLETTDSGMGGILTGPQTLWSREELEEIERVKAIYAFGFEFVKRELFHCITIRSGKKSNDPTAALWIEPVQPEIDQCGDYAGSGSPITEVFEEVVLSM